MLEQSLQRLRMNPSFLCWMLLLLCVSCLPSYAEDGWKAWLTYSRIAPSNVFGADSEIPEVVVSNGDSGVSATAREELMEGMHALFGRSLHLEAQLPERSAIVLGTVEKLRAEFPELSTAEQPGPEGFLLRTVQHQGRRYYLVAGKQDIGVLYGTYALLREMAEGHNISQLAEVQSPAVAVRWVNQWDNLDGSIERGYAGRSIFFSDGKVVSDLSRASQFARLLASVGINGCTVDNVNADLRILDSSFLPQLARIAEAFRPYGVKLSLSVDLSSPMAVGKLNTFDPLDPSVAAWWRSKVDEIYRLIPDFGGFVVKADSEGRPGPSQYKRSPADAANVLARALQPHGGYVLYRGFVYNHHLDWRDPKADRARAGYDNFRPYDGQFENNVIVQIKYGPIDFQVREPVSPLFAGLRKSNEAIELQITQEYTGQQRHLCFLVPMWKEILDTDMYALPDRSSKVKDIVEGHTFSRPVGGFVAVSNVGMNHYWLGHPLAMANLYGFGRLAWNPDLSAEQIVQEWTALSFGTDPRVMAVTSQLELNSWSIYEDYTGPLGAGTLTDIIGVHYGPGIESSERNGWGQWHRADTQGIGMDRTIATGTGYTGQYPKELQERYESLATCPDNLLLFFHHVSYKYRLHSGKTVIQHIYDSHYEGAAKAAAQVGAWQQLHGSVPDDVYFEVLRRLSYQAGHAEVWRDAVSEWFLKMSGIPDEAGRAGHHPNRTEAEQMQLSGYTPVEVHPWETASAGEAVICPSSTASPCTAGLLFRGTAGWYDLNIGYFDPRDGAASYQLFRNGWKLDEWRGADDLPSNKLDGHTATRRQIKGIFLVPGDTLKVIGVPEDKDSAPLDFIDVNPENASEAGDRTR